MPRSAPQPIANRPAPIAPPTDPLLGCGAGELARRIAGGEVSARQVVEAHLSRIEEVDPVIRAFAIPLSEQALAAADAADQQQARGAALGLLHGVPISIKEAFFVRDTPSTMGLTALASERVEQDGELVARLRTAGGIFLGKTNVSQLMLFHDSDNPVYGRTNNPWDLDRTPGGSSGGEGAAVAASCSPLGLGSDLGGSLRVPAHFCGIHSLKPGMQRLERVGARVNVRGMEAIAYQPGPLARRVEDLDLAMRVLIGEPPSSGVDTPPVAWPDYRRIDVGRLRIGIWESDAFFPAAPAIRRVVREAGETLAALGAEVEPYCPVRLEELVETYYATIGADGGADARRLVQGSQVAAPLKKLFRLARLPASVRQAVCAGLSLFGQRRHARLVSVARSRTADQYWQLVRRIVDWQRGFAPRLAEANLDAVLAPPHALPALRHGTAAELLDAACYCYPANLLGIPAGTLSIGRVGADEETDRAVGRDQVDRIARDAERGSAGLPAAVQVLAPQWREDIVLAVMAALEGAAEATGE